MLRAGDGARTHDSHVGNADADDAKDNPANGLHLLSVSVARQLHSDPDFSRLAAAWQDLPTHIRAAMLALLDTVQECRAKREESEESQESRRGRV